MKSIIIQGSSRSKGNTNKIVHYLLTKIDADFIDLKDYDIHQYDYEHAYEDDDFLPLMRKITDYDLVIFATPVYWYAMSGIMKIFFDRITDCLKIDKETGRKLRGMSMAMLSCGSDKDSLVPIKEFFDFPFRASAEYLGMNYEGSVQTWIEGEGIPAEVKNILEDFTRELKQK